MRRIALFSDVHGNLAALDAVLGDIAAAELPEMYCLGDLVGYGPNPAGVIERVRSLAIPTIAGNYDDGVGNRRGSCGCYYATPAAIADGEASYAFTDAALSDSDHDWLAQLPAQIRLGHAGLRILLVHGSPRKINEYLLPDRTDTFLARLADEAEADVVCVGHVHIPYHRVLIAAEGRRVDYVSCGSVGKPKDGDARATWVELLLGDDESEEPVATLTHRVSYDVGAVASAIRSAGLPERIAAALLGG
ncbi:MAG: metallophosphoesterase family protein [Coriobacteriia bacterium]|nr:metallophosphoesterase family protein [Coriobacteriia bacterium]